MNNDLFEKATALAHRRYTVEVYHDTNNDQEIAYLVKVAELEGCMAQGATIEDALESLRDATVDYIYSLLEDGLPVPEPKYETVTISRADKPITAKWKPAHPSSVQFEKNVSKDTEQDRQELLYSYSTDQS